MAELKIHQTWLLPVLGKHKSTTMVPDQDEPPAGHYTPGSRKLSTPSVKPLPSSPSGQAVNAKRRFSHVGLVVPRRLSMVTAKPTPSPETMIVGRALAGLYVRSRLKRAGLFSRRPGLGAGAAGVAPIVKEVYPVLACAAGELERMHPRVFSNVVRQVGGRYSGAGGGKDDVDEAAIFLAVAQQVLNTDSWGAVVAVYCVMGALAVECTRYGHGDQVDVVLDAMGELLEDRLALWVAQRGGWTALARRCRMRRTRSRLSLPLPLALSLGWPSAPALLVVAVPACALVVVLLYLLSVYF